ncbi:UDP-forming cellulose synthase catalytic subunit [Azotobacter salinestris]|uniref:UDP-forming cellulose synthase catalytic subunit n=1 Tax=Azotobacter salinestris TaxID=69964 RepID=UPI0032DFC54B
MVDPVRDAARPGERLRGLAALWPYRYLRECRGATAATAVLFCVLQALVWLVLHLESPAWQAVRRDHGRWFPHLANKVPTLGDPLRYGLQGLWLLLTRPVVLPRPTVRRGLWHSATAPLRWLRLWHGLIRDRIGRRLQNGRIGTAAETALAGLSRCQRGVLAGVLGLFGTALALLCITEPFGLQAQLLFSLLLWMLAMALWRLPGSFPTLLLILLSTIVSCRYLWWRYNSTLNWDSALDLTLGLVLLAAETYAWLVLVLGYIQSGWPLRRTPAPLPADTAQWPTVDLMIPTYNEDLAVVQTTVFAALGLDWPAGKLRIHLLDDGRRESFRRFAAEVGVGYITRPDNRHAKAGNLNHALTLTDGELVAIFDCDHVPVRSFLQLTVGWFLRDPKLALVQTPHHFFSPDPFERNLGTFGREPNEGELFYGLVQDGNDLWNAAFFCGSCAVLRRAALEAIGGFAVETVTEDAHTALRLHRHGWNSAYLRIPQAAGLATETLAAHIGQRIRWARGMVQILRTDNPLFGKGLSPFQRLCYINAMLHFLAGLPRLVFLTAPLAFLLLHAYIIYAPALMILLYVLPHMLHASLAGSRLQSDYRHILWGELYETVLAWYIARPTTLALFAPKLGAFNVTAKGGLIPDGWFDWRTARPYLVLAALNALGLGFAVWRLFHGPAEEIGTVVVSSLWVLFNLLIIGGAVAVSAEVRQVRQNHRVTAVLEAVLRLPDGRAYPCLLSDYSVGGAGIKLPQALTLAQGLPATLLLARGRREFAFPCTLSRCLGRQIGIRFDGLSRQQQIDLVQCTFARADAWLNRTGRHGEEERLLSSVASVLRLGGRGYLRLFEYAPGWLRRLLRPVSRLLRWLSSFLPRSPLPAPSPPPFVHMEVSKA